MAGVLILFTGAQNAPELKYLDEVVAAGGAPESPQGWEALALLAVTTAVVRTLPSWSRRSIRRRLSRIAEDWERADPPLPEPAMRSAAERFIRPLLAHLESQEVTRQ